MSKVETVLIMTVASYFLAQTVIIISKKWKAMSPIDRVWSLETLILTAAAFCMSCDILLDHRFKEFNKSTILGKLFGLEGGVVNKIARNAYFRGRVHLEELEKNEGFKDDLGEDGRGYRTEGNSKNFGNTNNGVTNSDHSKKSLKNRELNLFNTLNYVDAFQNYSQNQFPKEEMLGRNELIIISDSSMSVKIEAGVENYAGKSEFSEKFDEHMVEINGNRMELEEITNFMSFNTGKLRRPSFNSMLIIKRNSEKCSKRIKLSKFMILSLCLGISIVPLINIIFYFVKDTKIVDLKTAFLTYFPFTDSSSPENIGEFVFVVFFEYLYVYLFFKLGMDMVTIALLGYSMTHTEIELLMKSLEELNRYLGKIADRNCGKIHERILINRFNHVTAHHQDILRKIQTMSNLVSFRVIYVNGAICLELCIAIFLLVEGDYSFKLKYILVALCVVIILAQLSEDGQLVENELEDVRNAFFMLGWLSVPLTVQKSLLIVLTRCCRPPRIGSMGVFYINRMNFSSIIRASYSYFNLLNRLQKK